MLVENNGIQGDIFLLYIMVYYSEGDKFASNDLFIC